VTSATTSRTDMLAVVRLACCPHVGAGLNPPLQPTVTWTADCLRYLIL
jgi:hypothetical protein